MVEGAVANLLPDALDIPEPVVFQEAAADLLPDVIELEAQEEERLPEENKPERCIFGYSESGFCGAAAYCSELARCCADCDLSCSIRCGWLDQKEQAVSSPGQSEKIQEKDAAWFVKRFLEGRGKERFMIGSVHLVLA